MRNILVSIVALVTFLVVTFLLWRKRTRNVAQIAADLDSYWDGLKERRKFIRFRERLHVTCSVTEKDGSVRHIFSRDISGDGVCLQATEILPEGSLLDLKIDIHDSKPISIKGEVVWVEKTQTGPKGSTRLFYTGVKFAKVEPADKERLINFLDSTLTE